MTQIDYQVEQDAPYQVISRGEVAGEYQGFPDACRLINGDIVVVFYAGYGHISFPNEAYPTGGKICLVRSQDDGYTWSQPEVVYDDAFDNRDPHIAQLSDGTLICSFFSLMSDSENEAGYGALGAQTIRSADNGRSWGASSDVINTGDLRWVCSAPVREMPDGTCILPIYHQNAEEEAYGGVTHSYDGGLTWGAPIPIGKDSGLFLPAETDIVLLKDGRLYAALRGDQGKHMHYATSSDLGKSWSEVKDIGFIGHAPHFTRLSTGEILLTYRGRATDLRLSRDEAETWQGPYLVDTVWGAYPATVELKDGTVLVIYYTDEAGSAVRAMRFGVPTDLRPVPFG